VDIRVFIVCEDSVIQQTVDQLQGQLVPERFRRNNHEALRGDKPVISSFLLHPPGSHQQIVERIGLAGSEQPSGIIVLSVGSYALAVPPLSDVYFMSDVSLEYPLLRPDNLVSSLIGRALTDFMTLSARFQDRKFEKILRLPIRNFHAIELTQLRDIYRQTFSHQDFGQSLDKGLKAFKSRQKPKRKKGNGPAKYLVDDSDNHFELGHELHAQADTSPPHTTLCIAANRHRFGHHFKSIEHFNVSRDGGVMDADYPNCHGKVKKGGGANHLNMFTNDFF
jgi:hypothetical protein